MRTIKLIPAMLTKALAVAVLLSATGAALAQSVALSAAPATTTLSDGSIVPMWGYTCGAASGNATCAPLNPAAAGGWSPVVITVPSGQDLQITLTNNLSFPTGPSTANNTVPTSLVIVGQIGGGLGAPTSTTSPDHSGVRAQTWPIAGGAAPSSAQPPAQGNRVQSFGTEVASGAAQTLCWGACGSNGPALLPGTYLIESGTHPSIQVPMGLYGILVVTDSTRGIAYPSTKTRPVVNYDADIAFLLSEIDPVQNNAVAAAVGTVGFNELTVWSGVLGGCGAPTVHSCYPPAVNYTPTYFLFNGRAFDATNAQASLFTVNQVAATTPLTGNLLVRLVNAGLKMHVPSIVGAKTGAPSIPGMTLVAEDGNVLPGSPRVQNEVFMAAGKTSDVLINVPATGAPALAIYDRQLSLSANATGRNSGMLAYIGSNNAALPSASGAGAFGKAQANDDIYNAVVAGQTLVISDPSKGVIANDVRVTGVTVLTPPVNGTLSLNADGTFTYVANASFTSDVFTYCANGTVSSGVCSSGVQATVTLGASKVASGVTCTSSTFTSVAATTLAIRTPGVLAGCTDAAGLPVSVDPNSIVPSTGLQVVGDANGGFTATAPGAGTYTFMFTAKNSLGGTSAPTQASLVFPAGSNLQVTVLDGLDHTTAITDYRWIIEEDRTFYVDPACT